MTVKDTVYQFLDNESEQVFSLWGLTDRIELLTGIRTMPHRIREICKVYADASGGEFYCVDRKHSKYYYKPCFKITGSLGGKE